MSYYQRPMGDYKTYGYAGDPGFLSSLWKGVKKVGGAVLKAAFPVPAAIYGAVTSKPSPPLQFPQAPTSFPGVGARGPMSPGWAGYQPGGLSWTGGPGGVPTVGGAPTAGACPSGYHLAKDGSGRLVRNRRMNVANPRALRRSMRRVQGFEKLARRTITFTRRTRMKKRKTS